MICADFDALPPSFNSMLRAHWATRRHQKQYWMLRLRDALQFYKPPEPCEITVTWRVMREMDPDNAKARFKLIGDALVQTGYLSDDNNKVIGDLKIKQRRVKHFKEQGFTMEIKEYLPFTEIVIPMRREPVGKRERWTLAPTKRSK